ncbi:MAG: protein translocase subunit SecF [Clostridia bacterium]|nr:protein translocase subunit SecF [Clostridia bacterium]
MHIVKNRKIFFAISLLIIIPSIVSFLYQGLNLGIDFTGGTSLNLKFEQKVSDGQVREVLDDFGIGNKSIIQAGGDNLMLLKTVPLEQKKRDAILEKMNNKLGKVKVTDEDTVGSVIGSELTEKALLALGIASVLMVIYITFRFEFFFGIAAILALMHDVVVVVGVFSIFQWDVDLTFVAAILTIIGYSINDTIVIFDRIRENLKFKKKEESLEDLVNKSILQTITRSINTVLTVLFVLIAMYFFGGETIENFTVAMLIGIVTGMYSSIFTASPIWLELKNWQNRRQRAAKMAQ